MRPTIHGRGTADNPPNRFEPIDFQLDGDFLDAEERPAPQTVYLRDTARTIIATNDSPDIGFTHSVNIYRGCSHGCIYCYARPGHEYFGLSAGLDFETKIFIKEQAPRLLREELAARKWKPTALSLSGVQDCYQPIERKMTLTRQCLKVLAEFRNPVTIVTKSHLVTRDIDVLQELAGFDGVAVMVSVTTLQPDVARTMEPRAASPTRRLAAIEALAKAGVPVGVMVAPIVPGLTDHETPMILKSAADAGARFCGYVVLRLPYAVKDLFTRWLEDHYPDRKEKVLNRVRDLRNGKLYDSAWATRQRGEGEFAEQFEAIFKLAKRRYGLDKPFPSLSTEQFRRPVREGDQLSLF